MPNFDDNMQWEFNGGTLPNNSQMSPNHLKCFDHVLAIYKINWKNKDSYRYSKKNLGTLIVGKMKKLYMYVCMHVCMYVYMYVCMYVYKYLKYTYFKGNVLAN